MGSTVIANNRTMQCILESETPKIIDLPVSTGNPTEIEIPDRCSAVAFMYVGSPFHYTNADAGDATSAKVIIDSDASRGRIDNVCQIDAAGMSHSIYVRSIGAAVIDGLSYQFMRQS